MFGQSAHPYVSALTTPAAVCLDWTISFLDQNEVWNIQSVVDGEEPTFHLQSCTLASVKLPPASVFVCGSSTANLDTSSDEFFSLAQT